MFLDTNILVYAIDESSQKRRKAEQVLRKAAADGTGVISTQVLQEFYVNATRKLGVSPAEAQDMVRDLRNLDVVTVTADLIEESIGISVANQLSFWDALVLAAAKAARCSTLVTEDLSHGSRLVGIRIENPFAI